jgi:hypothetical protein
MKHCLPFLLFLTLFAAGCGEQGVDPKLVKNPTTEEMNAAKSRRSELIAIYKRAGGKWENLTPADKAKIIEYSGGSESMAQMGWPALGSMSD